MPHDRYRGPVRIQPCASVTRLGSHCGAAPEFSGASRWFNTDGRPLTIAGLRGKVVLVDFWTYSCINCLRDAPYVKKWDAAYRAGRLVVVGVHARVRVRARPGQRRRRHQEGRGSPTRWSRTTISPSGTRT